MKITICDICWVKDTKEEKATYRVGYKRGMKIDACDTHKNVNKGKTQEEFGAWYFGLMREGEKVA